MRVTRLILLLTLLVPLTLLARPREERAKRPEQAPRVINSDPAPRVTNPRLEVTTDLLTPPRFDITRPAAYEVSATGGSLIRWFGSYSPVTRAAVENDIWSFDHEGGDPLEGWTSYDDVVSYPVAWRRITTASWAGHGNPVPAPLIFGTGSMWLGIFEDEADSLCWASGLGYGNDWVQRWETPTLTYLNMTGPSVSLSFDYFCDIETPYDFVNIILKVNGVRVDTVASYTGSIGSPSSPTFAALSADIATHAGPAGQFSFVFELVSDGSYSDEDGLYPTTNGAFGLDNLAIQQNVVEGDQTYSFNTTDHGCVASIPPGAGTYLAANPSSDYVLVDASCGIENKVLTFHDGDEDHPFGQNEVATSPAVALPTDGTGPYNIFADFRAYSDLPWNAGVIWQVVWTYYPHVCPATGDSAWSPLPSAIYFGADPPECTAWRDFATRQTGLGPVPAGMDSVRFHLRVWSTCPDPWPGNCSIPPNFSPIFDNLRVGVTDSTILHVPSYDYPNIQTAIDAAADGDTVLVKAGTYTGVGNRDLDFAGKAILVVSEEGPESTIIDCAGISRGVWFNTLETSTSILDGFTVTNGLATGSGMFSVTSPTIRNCWFIGNGSVSFDGGGVYVAGGSPVFEDCLFAANEAQYGGGIYVGGGSPTFIDCLIVGNSVNNDGGAVYVMGTGTPSFVGCTLTSNEVLVGTTAGIVSEGVTGMTRCIVYGDCNPAKYVARTGSSGTISFVCCDVEQTRVLGAGIGYDGGTIFADPLFCAPAECDSVPTAEGNYTLASDSPCLPGFSPCGDLIGALGVGCFGSIPQLTSVEDVPNDQGRQARLTWMRSAHDSPTGPMITGYTVWRRIDPLAAPILAGDPMPESVRYRPLAHPGAWDYVGLVQARGDDEYHYVAPTLCDSTDDGVCWSTFFVSAVTADPLEYYDSGTRSGYSVDNLAPAVPQGLLFSSYQLTWNEAPEEDFDYFTVYGSSVEVFDETAVVVGHLVGTELDVHSDPWRCYHVTATDFAGNEGEAASTVNPLAVPEPGVTPTAFALVPNWPNPFRSSTRIGFDLPVDSSVRLQVFDVSGRLVRVLLDSTLPAGRYSVPWSGLDEVGRRVSPGIYFYRVEAGEYRETRKAMVIR